MQLLIYFLEISKFTMKPTSGKLVLTGGRPSHMSLEVDVLDLSDEHKTCNSLEKLTGLDVVSNGGLVNNKLVVCGRLGKRLSCMIVGHSIPIGMLSIVIRFDFDY
jgi:hypothetical protein